MQTNPTQAAIDLCIALGIPDRHAPTIQAAFAEREARNRTDAAPVAWMPMEIEKDAEGHTLICTGCGTVETVRSIRANHATARTCCPERKMVRASPATDVAALVEENKKLRDEWQFLADLLDKNFAENDQPNRVMWDGEWYEGPLAEAYHATFNAVRKLARQALAPFTKGQNDD